MPNEPIGPAPSVAALQRMVDNTLVDEALTQIKRYKLALEIVGNRVVHSGHSTEAWLDKYITKHPDLLELKEEVLKLSKEKDEVLIVGETGTGKEILARALHGNRPAMKFIAFNCAGVPDTLIEADLFGHTKQAFTGATEAKPGLMKVAEDGTLFLDEIGEMPATIQAKLLRALQERRVRKLGGTVEEEINCRIVCATNRPVSDMITKGTFRKDLYARISTFELHTISLHSRQEDIPLIIESLPGGKEFWSAWLLRYEKAKQEGISPTDWPVLDVSLNVRSLQQHVRRFAVLGKLP